MLMTTRTPESNATILWGCSGAGISLDQLIGGADDAPARVAVERRERLPNPVDGFAEGRGRFGGLGRGQLAAHDGIGFFGRLGRALAAARGLGRLGHLAGSFEREEG